MYDMEKYNMMSKLDSRMKYSLGTYVLSLMFVNHFYEKDRTLRTEKLVGLGFQNCR